MDFDTFKDRFDSWVMQTFDFPKTDQAQFLDDVASLLESNVKELKAFEMYMDAYEGPQQKLATRVAESIGRGGNIAEGFRGFIPDEVLVTLRVAEEKGVLPPAMKNAASYLRVSAAGLTVFVKKCTYPLVFVILATILAAFMDANFYPMLRDILPYEKWPDITKTIYGAWSVFLANLPFILLSLAIVTIFVIYLLSSWTGLNRTKIDGWPLFLQYRMQQTSILLKSLGLLLKNNVTLLDAIRELERDQKPYVQWHLRRVQRNIGIGHGTEADYLNTGLLTPEQVSRLKVLSHASDFEIAMERMGDQTLSLVQAKFEKAAGRLSSLLFIVSGSAIASVPVGYMSVTAAIGG